MAGIVTALLSGALMSVQGVFNTGVTKQTSVWVASGWVQATALIACVVIWFLRGDRRCGDSFRFLPSTSFRRYHRGGDHLYSDPQHAVFRTGTDCPSHRSGTDHHSICDPAVWMVWHRKNAF